jgi:hypothetical protein
MKPGPIKIRVVADTSDLEKKLQRVRRAVWKVDRKPMDWCERAVIAAIIISAMAILAGLIWGVWAWAPKILPVEQDIRSQVAEAVAQGNTVREYSLFPGLNMLQIDAGGGVRAVGPVTCETCGGAILLGQSWYVDGDYAAHLVCDGVVPRVGPRVGPTPEAVGAVSP